jgi:hypothetical protein
MVLAPDIRMSIRIEPASQMVWLWVVYLYTHIQPSQEDFCTQIKNYNPVYLFLHWSKLEQFYPRYLEEEMDLEAVRLMRAEHFEYFGIRQRIFFSRPAVGYRME